MQVRVRASQLVKGRRRFIDWVIEVNTIRGWRVLRNFAISTNARPSLWPVGDNIEFVTP